MNCKGQFIAITIPCENVKCGLNACKYFTLGMSEFCSNFPQENAFMSEISLHMSVCSDYSILWCSVCTKRAFGTAPPHYKLNIKTWSLSEALADWVHYASIELHSSSDRVVGKITACSHTLTNRLLFRTIIQFPHNSSLHEEIIPRKSWNCCSLLSELSRWKIGKLTYVNYCQLSGRHINY